VALLLMGNACGPKRPARPDPDAVQVRFRPVPEPTTDEALWLLQEVPGGTWDKGLHKATRALVGASRDRLAQLSPKAIVAANAQAGYPGNARFFRELTGGGPPEILTAQLRAASKQRSQPFDLALARKAFGDGTLLWIGAVAHRPALLDPIPLEIPLDSRLPISIEILDESAGDPLGRIPDPVLFVTTPFGAVSAFPLHVETARWIDGFHTPGRYQMEVVARGHSRTQVVLKWAIFVDQKAGPVPSLAKANGIFPNPLDATHALYSALNALRSEAGLPPVTRFQGFEPLAREHAAFMALSGVVDHQIAGMTPGVAAKANARFHPGAKHHENLAAAPDWQDALDLVRLSPGHLANLLCVPCTHASIGVALEPVTDRVPRLFVVWELLEFPEGPPVPLPQR
jgi:hypothetical protein